VYDDSYGFWRRVRLIPFTQVFKYKADDKELLGKLIAEAPGILAWMIEGCLHWQKEGLEPTPECILAATKEYEAESDPLADFIQDECVIAPQGSVLSSNLYKNYRSWCATQGMVDREILTSNAFGRKMGQKFKKSHERDGAHYVGLAIKCDGFVTDFQATFTENNINTPYNSRVGDKEEIPSQSVNPSRDGLQESVTDELPGCPGCGRNEWQYSPDGKFLICPCGRRMPVLASKGVL
jgi:phage/plasmid-associated DNA primase